ncbi:MAG: hypothetical protein NT076_04875 [Candidatus Pacearchaeota archaeon]|nr:hypothetical protein [Candidatus Pacearchaeota archaeon]
MKKIGAVLILFLFLISLTLVSAAANETDEKAIACLESKLGNNCGNSDSVEQLSFSLLAMGHESSVQSACRSALKSKTSSLGCLPSSSCNIKDTSLALLALSSIGENTDNLESWISSHNRTTDLEWYLEIDSSSATSCTISYDSNDYTISIAENKKISGSPGNCLALAYDNYWLRINSNCINTEFTISCDQSFISTLLYKRPSSNIWYISSDVQSSTSGGTTNHKVSSLCLGISSCSYEDTLLAVLALQKAGVEIKPYLPYLISYASDNTKYSSYSLLYFITNSNEYLANTLSQQKSQGYWDLGSDQKFYDTALALLAISDAPETKAKNWLAQNQGTDGCWNSGNIRDTAALIWGGWPRTAATVTETASCSGTGYCMSSGECYDAGGNILKNFLCSGVQVCCDKQVAEKTCQEKSGIICSSGKECSVAEVSASNTNYCCVGTCEEPVTTPECEQNSYSCRSSCLDGEETSSLACGSGKTCCKPSTSTPSGSSWWIWILVILIILVALAIIFRKRIQVWWFNRKHKIGESKVTQTRPGFPPYSALRPMMPRPPVRPQPAQARPAARPPAPKSKTDSELEATLKKLREMSK